LSAWLPWVVGAAVIVVFWVAESWLHAQLFDGRPLATDLLPDDAHEVWMRIVAIVAMCATAAMWSRQLRTQRKRLEEVAAYEAHLRTLMSSLAYGESEERRDIAHRLHDGVGQSLAAARLFLSEGMAAGAVPAEQTTLSSVRRILDRAIIETREIAEELSPASLNEYGLNAALESLANRTMVRTGVSVELDSLDEAVLSREVLLASYHAIAEIVATAATNPETRTVRLMSSRDAEYLELRVAWDAGDSTDLRGTRERLLQVGGDLSRDAGDAQTAVTVTAPLSTAA